MRRVLIASAVRKAPMVVGAFLRGLGGLRVAADMRVDWLLADDNDDPESSRQLELAVSKNPHGQAWVGLVSTVGTRPDYREADTHYWSAAAVERVAQVKDQMLDVARRDDYDGCLLVDADLVLHPDTLYWLWRAEKPIVAEVFWTRWVPKGPELPNVWLRDAYDMVPSEVAGEGYTDDDRLTAAVAWLEQLRRPGLYRVGGLGACTLLRRSALDERRLRFWPPLDNVSWWGEDRHFCLRAAAMGLERWADTHCSPLHLYRPADLDDLDDWWANQAAVPNTAAVPGMASTHQNARAGRVAAGTPTARLNVPARPS